MSNISLCFLLRSFDGNTDQDAAVYHALNPPITARYIRFKPVASYGHVSMRVELYGCLRCIKENTGQKVSNMH